MDHNKTSVAERALRSLSGSLCEETAPPLSINHSFQTPVHLQDLIRHLSSLSAICKTVTYQKCKMLKNIPLESWGTVYLLPGRGLEVNIWTHTPQPKKLCILYTHTHTHTFSLSYYAWPTATDIFKEQKVKDHWLCWKPTPISAVEGQEEESAWDRGLFFLSRT